MAAGGFGIQHNVCRKGMTRDMLPRSSFLVPRSSFLVPRSSFLVPRFGFRLSSLRAPVEARRRAEDRPAGRREWMHDVFVRDMDVPYKNPSARSGPARSAGVPSGAC
jgi:hypothetical protein